MDCLPDADIYLVSHLRTMSMWPDFKYQNTHTHKIHKVQ